jgi:hypothetical protein
LAVDDLEHKVSRMGTLAGITSKFRVEVISLFLTLLVWLLDMVFSVNCVLAK